MESKNAAAYRSIFDYIKSVVPNLNPTVIITDFERALQQSALEAFPNSQVVGCWFHSANVSGNILVIKKRSNL